MALIRRILLAYLVSLAIAHNLPHVIRQAVSGRPRCGLHCRFFLCANLLSVTLTAPGNVSNPEICRKNQEIDQILETGEALIGRIGRDDMPISEWRPEGLEPPFNPGVFRTAAISGEDNSGIQRTETEGNQNSFLHNRCLILPIKRYERVRFREGVRVAVPVTAGNPETDCVAFIAKTHDIVFEAQWLSGDDLDLSVKEPDGTLINFSNEESTCGFLWTDANVDTCDLREEGIELVHYSRSCVGFQTGVYIVELRHATNCLLTNPPKPTYYEIRVVIDGEVKRRAKGTSNKDNGELITKFRFVV